MSDYEAIENLEKRLGAATRRADGRGPLAVTVAGKHVHEGTGRRAPRRRRKQFLTDRKALAAAYDEAMAKLDAAEKSLATTSRGS